MQVPCTSAGPDWNPACGQFAECLPLLSHPLSQAYPLPFCPINKSTKCKKKKTKNKYIKKSKTMKQLLVELATCSTRVRFSYTVVSVCLSLNVVLLVVFTLLYFSHVKHFVGLSYKTCYINKIDIDIDMLCYVMLCYVMLCYVI